VSDVPDIYGVWRLQSYYLENMETAERTEVFGPKPNGVLILLPEGRMAAIITPTEQRQPTTEADEASAFRNLITYSGLYRLEPPDRFVTTVDVAWFQPWTGSQQARRFALHDDTLEIVSDPHVGRTFGSVAVRSCGSVSSGSLTGGRRAHRTSRS
jgi:lipocalin-like protein